MSSEGSSLRSVADVRAPQQNSKDDGWERVLEGRVRGWWRKVRAALSLGGMWGVASTLISGAAYALGHVISSGSVSWSSVLESALQYGVFGLAVGTAFAGTLVAFEGRNTLERLQAWRIALWGALMGGSFPMILEVLEGGATLASVSAMTGMTLFAAAVGATLSTGTVLLAKAAKAELGAGRSAVALDDASDDTLLEAGE